MISAAQQRRFRRTALRAAADRQADMRRRTESQAAGDQLMTARPVQTRRLRFSRPGFGVELRWDLGFDEEAKSGNPDD